MDYTDTNRGMFSTFCILQSISVIFIWTILIFRWTHHHDMPQISSYPIIDFAMKARQISHEQGYALSTSIPTSAGDTFIRHAFSHQSTVMFDSPKPITYTDVQLVMNQREKAQRQQISSVQEVEPHETSMIRPSLLVYQSHEALLTPQPLDYEPTRTKISRRPFPDRGW